MHRPVQSLYRWGPPHRPAGGLRRGGGGLQAFLESTQPPHLGAARPLPHAADGLTPGVMAASHGFVPLSKSPLAEEREQEYGYEPEVQFCGPGVDLLVVADLGFAIGSVPRLGAAAVDDTRSWFVTDILFDVSDTPPLWGY